MHEAPHLISVGIDIAKAKFDTAFLRSNESVEFEQYENTRAGIGGFLRSLNKKGTAGAVPVVLEATGPYHLVLALMLSKAGYRVNCINPIITKKYQRSSIRNAKTDLVDAERLARIGLLEPNLPVFAENPGVLEAKTLVTYLRKLEHIAQQLRASFQQVETMQAITGVAANLRPTQVIFRRLEQQIVFLKARICELAPAEATTLAKATRGLSQESMAIILAVLGDKQFANRDQLTAFVGLDVMPRQSGSWRGRGRLSKRGNGYVRKVLFQTAWALKQHNPTYRAHYERLRAAGKNYVTALIILARKFLRFLFVYYWKNGGCPQASI